MTLRTWRRLLDPKNPLEGFVMTVGGEVRGFAHTSLHESTWATNPHLYLEDLYVCQKWRGRSLGRRLLAWVIDLGASRGATYVYWHTAETNMVARSLYDQFTSADGMVRYRFATAALQTAKLPAAQVKAGS